MITILFSVLLVVLYRLTQEQIFHGLSINPESFFGKESWKRKYKSDLKTPRFPGSTTILVSLTDFYHCGQLLMLRCLNVIIADNMPGNFWLWFLGSWVVVSGIMYLTEKLFSVKKT